MGPAPLSRASGHAIRAALACGLTLAGAAPALAAEEPRYTKSAQCVAEGPALDSLTRAISPAQREVGQTRLWGLSRGAGVTVAVIDSGVRPHPAFGDRLKAGGDFIVPSAPRPGLVDCDGHGTAVAGLIAAAPDPETGFAGVAPEATILAIRQTSSRYSIEGQDGAAGTSTTLTEAVDDAVDAGATVINISAAACGPALTAQDPRLAAAVERAIAEDVVVVVAAGNAGAEDCEQNPLDGPLVSRAIPADVPGALTVGAVTRGGHPAAYSLTGPWVDVAAPGDGIISLNPHPDRVGEVDRLVTPDGTQPMQGTSYAAPYVSGVVALVRARYPRLSAEQVVRRIQVTAAHPAGAGERNNAVGYGVVDARQALTAEIPGEGATGTPVEPGGSGAQGAQRAAAMPALNPVVDDTRGQVLALVGSTALLALLAAAVLMRLIRRRPVPARGGPR